MLARRFPASLGKRRRKANAVKLRYALLVVGAFLCASIGSSVLLPDEAVAIATLKVTLNSTTWTDLGTGPLLLNSGGTSVVYAIGDVTPTIPAGQGFALVTNVNQTVNTNSHIWAMAATPSPAFVFVSPIIGSSGGSGGSGSAPVNSALPAITGTAQVGQTLSTTNGTWTGATTYSWQWWKLVNPADAPGAAGSSAIVGATTNSWTIPDASYIGFYAGVVVTAANVYANATANNATPNAGPITAAVSGSPPSNTAAPAVSGTPVVGNALSVSNGTWAGTPPITYTYQWWKLVNAGDAPGAAGSSAIAGATTNSWTIPDASYVGLYLAAVVTATNIYGLVSANSATPNAGPVTSGGGATTVWSAADASANSMTLTNGGLTVNPTINNRSIRGTNSKTSGKLYVEFKANASYASDYITWGLASAGFNISGAVGTSNYSGGIFWSSNNVSAGFTSNYTTAPVPGAGDVMALAVDFSAGSIWIALNNLWLGSSNPATGTLPILSFVPATVGALFPAMSWTGPQIATEQWTLQPTAASQKYAPPSGFQAWDGGTGGGGAACNGGCLLLMRIL